MEEAALIQALKEGSHEAFRTLVADHGDRVYNTVLSMMQRPYDAEDVVQEVFTAVYRHIDRFRGDAKLSTWIYRIAVTKSLEAIRKGVKQKERFESEFPRDADKMQAAAFYHPGLQAENRERGAVLFRALQRLPDSQKTAFVLHKTEGLSYAEIAVVLKITLPAVESLIYRARQTLQKLLAGYYYEQ